jgi:uncharacterized protein with HEPN domain
VSDVTRLKDILVALNEIERYASSGRTGFDSNELIQSWIIHRLLIIGEAASQLSATLREQYPHVPFRRVIGMRNVLIHGYHQIDLDTVWSVVETDLPALRQSIETMLRAEAPSQDGPQETR